MTIAELTNRRDADTHVDALSRLLCEAVNQGATVGFLAPLPPEIAAAYWRSVFDRLGTDLRVVIALDAADEVVGTGQLLFPWQPNGAHRAEIAKIIVRQDSQRGGVGLAILRALEQMAIADGRRLLVLNTRTSGSAFELYRRAGFVRSGEIPGYTSDADGSLQDTTIMYRWLADSDDTA